MKPLEWLKLNFKVGAFSFGGGGRAFYFQDALVNKSQTISKETFFEATTVSQMIPGPNLVNLDMYLGLELVGFKWMLIGVLLLCLPGALLGVWLYLALDLSNLWLQWLFKGFSLGSVTFFFIFVARLAQGLKTTHSQSLPRRKFVVRWLLAVGIASASLYGWPLTWILISGAVLGLIVEFTA